MALDSIYTDLILEYSRSSHNRRRLEHPDCSERGHNPSCGDDITLELKLDKDRIVEAAFTGQGCAISQASTAMMIDLISGKSLQEAKAMADAFIAMIQGRNTDEAQLKVLSDALVFKNIANLPARVKCANLAWHTLKIAAEKSMEES